MKTAFEHTLPTLTMRFLSTRDNSESWKTIAKRQTHARTHRMASEKANLRTTYLLHGYLLRLVKQVKSFPGFTARSHRKKKNYLP